MEQYFWKRRYHTRSHEITLKQDSKTSLSSVVEIISMIGMNGSKSTANFSNNNSNISYGCSYMSTLIWNADDTVNIVITYVITCVACPFTVLLNTLIIAAVAKKESLQRNSNILLSSLAVTDLLVGAVSQPLSIIRGAFDFHHDNPPGFLCTLDLINIFVLYGACCISVCHLTAVAWERNTRMGEDLNQPTSVSRNRIKALIFASWMSAVIFVVPGVMHLVGVNYKYIMPLDISLAIAMAVLLFLIVYYYVTMYIKIRRLKFDAANLNVSQIALAKSERQIAFTTGLLTVALLVSYIPSIAMVLFGYFSPVLRRSSYFFWAMTMTEINSLANPLLYCCRNRQMRHAMLELLRREETDIPAALAGRGNSIHPINDIPLEDLQIPHVQ